jgi:hypothetical protein
MKTRGLPILVLPVLLLVSACKDSTEPLVPTTLQLDQLSVSLEITGTAIVNAQLLDQHGAPFAMAPSGFEITWTTANPTIARVEGGTITGVGIGQTTITASAGSLPPIQVAVSVLARTHTGELSFDYNGDREGTFAVAPTFQLVPGSFPPNAVITFFDVQWRTQDVFASRPRDDGRIDFIWFWTDNAVSSPATRPVARFDGGILFGVVVGTNIQEVIYEVVSGTVTFSSVTADRLRGTFALTLDDDSDNMLEVTNGTFDAPLVLYAEIASDSPANDRADTAAREGLRELREWLSELRSLRRVH